MKGKRLSADGYRAGTVAAVGDGWENIHTAREILTRERTDAQEARRWFRMSLALAAALALVVVVAAIQWLALVRS